MEGTHYYNTYLTREERFKFRYNFLNYGKTPGQFDFYLASEFNSSFEFISNGFMWSETPEGNDYWFHISNRTTQVDKKETRVLTPYKFI